MKIYIDSDFKCHTSNLDNLFREVETDFFEDDKCVALIEGYCYNDSKGYTQIYSLKPYNELNNEQREYKKQSFIEYNETFSCLIE